MFDVIELTRKLVDISSITGQENEVGEFVYRLLYEDGWSCEKQIVSLNRFNVLAIQGDPAVLLATHLDTVPPFFPSEEDEEFIWGRGACDAKGIAAAMICAASSLVKEGMTNIGLLFVVGEETNSDGATKASQVGPKCQFLINGEPTDNVLAIAHKGIISAEISVQGVSSHSAYPEKGVSAIEILIDILNNLRSAIFPKDDLLGESHVNIGTIEGGRASNVVADFAKAKILIRTVCESERYVTILNKQVRGRGKLELVKTSEPQNMEIIEGFDTKTVGYGTDIPVLRALGKPLLFGPGSIFEAHTAKEKISKSELVKAVKLYQDLVLKLVCI
jgi:acetylornithine deacetylase